MSGVGLQDELDARGYAVLPALVRADDCAALRARFDDDAAFRSTVVMERHGYGRGVYRYFAAPVPPLVAALRARLYAELAPVANAWAEALREDVRYPATLDGFLERCREAGQTRPTPLLLRVSRRRPQRAAPRAVRGRRVSASGDRAARRAGARLRGRRVRPGRAAATQAEPGPRRPAAARRRGRLPQRRAARARGARRW